MEKVGKKSRFFEKIPNFSRSWLYWLTFCRIFHPWKSHDFILKVPTFCQIFRKNLEWDSFFNNFLIFFEKIRIFSKNEYFCIFLVLSTFCRIFQKTPEFIEYFNFWTLADLIPTSNFSTFHFWANSLFFFFLNEDCL